MSKDFEPPFVVGVDVGTRSIRALAFDAFGSQVARAHRPTPESHSAPERTEYDPESLFLAVVECLGEVARALAGRPVAGIAVASIGESCVLVDEAGRALAPSIAWFDGRTDEVAHELRESVGIEHLFQIAGLKLDPAFTVCKLIWMREHWPDAMRGTHKVLMIADWIAFRLTSEMATDFTLASRTLYLDLRHRRWSDELIGLAGFDSAVLPPLTASGTALGVVRPEVLAATGLAGKPVVGVGAHDHVCGAMAVGMGQQGTMIDSIGTAEDLLLATELPSFDPMLPKLNLFQGAVEAHRSLFYFGGSVAHSGGAIEWFRGLVGRPPHDVLIGEGQRVPPGSAGILFHPNTAGISSSDPDRPVRGTFIGLTDAATRGLLYRAVLEGLALRAAYVVDEIAGLSGVAAPERIRLIGGGSRNPLLAAIKANAFGRPVAVVEESEATALGAALLGGIAGEQWPSLEAALATLQRQEHIVDPDQSIMRLYKRVRDSAFDRLQSMLWPLDSRLMEIAGQIAHAAAPAGTGGHPPAVSRLEET